jgi:hypothetical protein
MRSISFAIALAFAMLLLPRPALADGQVRTVSGSGTEKMYPGLEIVNAADAVYFIDVTAHQMLIVLKSGCSLQNTLTLCTGTTVIWDRYGVRTDLDATQVSLYINGTSKAAAIKDTAYTLTPKTLKLDIVMAKGTHVTGMGYVDSTQAP